MATKEELEEKRRARAAAAEAEADEQHLKDLAALDELEELHGYGAIGAVKVRFHKGQPTRALFLKPSREVHKRYTDRVNKAVVGSEKRDTRALRDAQEELAKAVWVYPPRGEAQEAMLGAFPGLLSSIALAALKVADGVVEEEGKD